MLKSFACLLLSGGLILSVNTEAAAQSNEHCLSEIAQGGDWTEVERLVWRQICLGKEADVVALRSGGEKRCNGVADVASEPSLGIRSAFLVDIIEEEAYREQMSPKGVRIRCARLEGPLTLDHAVVEGDLSLSDSFIDGRVRASSSDITGSFILKNSILKSRFNMDNTSLGRDFKISGTTVEDRLHLKNAEIGGNLELVDLEIASDEEKFESDDYQISVRNTAVHHDVLLSGTNFANNIRIGDTEVGGTIHIRDSSASFFNAPSLDVDGNVNVRDSAFDTLRFPGLRLRRNLSVRDSEFRSRLHLFGARVQDSIMITNNVLFHADLQFPTVERNIDFSGNLVGDEINLTGADIQGELRLQTIENGPVEFTGDAKLTLRNARADSLNESWAVWESLRAGQLDLVGFEYQRFGGFSNSWTETLAHKSVEELMIWLGKQNRHGGVHIPQPYSQLASVLRKFGYPEKADAILAASQKAR